MYNLSREKDMKGSTWPFYGLCIMEFRFGFEAIPCNWEIFSGTISTSGVASGYQDETCCGKMPIKRESMVYFIVLHEGKTNRISIAKILILIVPQDIFSRIFHFAVGIDFYDPGARCDIFQKGNSWLMSNRTAYQDICFGDNKVCCCQMMVVF
jgi:hypothetical protein